ncbi:unnamed protein product, partial [marine sediment metagenome]
MFENNQDKTREHMLFGVNSIYPDPESRDIILQILLKLCESDVVAAIGCFHFRLDNIKLQSPDARGFDYASNNDGERKYKLRTGFDAKLNKLAGLYVEREEKARKRINNSVIEDSYCIEPGLNGIRKGISYIKSLYKDERDNLPRYLRKINLKYFKFSIGIIWDMDKDRNMLEDGSFEFISYDRDSISGTCGPSGCCFNFYNHDGWDYYLYNKPYFISHLNKIQKILDDISPGKYEPRPEGEYNTLLKLGIINRKGREFYTIDEKVFEEAVHLHGEEISEQIQENLKLQMKEFEKIMVKYNEKVLEGGT